MTDTDNTNTEAPAATTVDEPSQEEIDAAMTVLARRQAALELANQSKFDAIFGGGKARDLYTQINELRQTNAFPEMAAHFDALCAGFNGVASELERREAMLALQAAQTQGGPQ